MKEINDHHYLQRITVIAGYKINKIGKKVNKKENIYYNALNRDFKNDCAAYKTRRILGKNGLKVPDFNDYQEPEYVCKDFFKRQIAKNKDFKERGFTFYNGRKWVIVDKNGKIIG